MSPQGGQQPPRATSHNLTVPSSLAAGHQAVASPRSAPRPRPRRCGPCRVASRPPAPRLPQPDRPVPAAAGHQPPSPLSATPQTTPVCPCTASSSVRSTARHRRTSPVGVPAARNCAIGVERDRGGVGERLGQHRLGEVGAHQAGVLRLHSLQIRLPEGTARERSSPRRSPRSSRSRLTTLPGP